jgi:hypothetical protein
MAWFGFMVFNATLDNISVLSWHAYTKICHGRGHMVVGFANTYAIGAYHH